MSLEVQRKLTTILSADAEGYSRLMQADEVRALGNLQAARAVFSKFIQRHHGRIANTAGDGLIADFPSVVEAVQCAIEVQQELGRQSNDPGGALHFRIGIHLGDVMVDGDDLLGEGVNLAARLQSMAEPGGILMSQQVYDQVHAKLSVGFDYLGEKRPKNFAQDVSVYGVSQGKGHGPRSHIKATPPATEAPRDRAAHLEPEHLRDRVLRLSAMVGAIWVALVVIDLVSGPPFWAHFPGIVLATLLFLYAAPLMVGRWSSLLFSRGMAIVLGLLLINIFTWSGYFWAMWPAGGLILIEVMRRFGLRKG